MASWHSEAMVMNLGKLREMVREAWCSCPWSHKELDMARQLNNVCKAHIPW